MLAASLTALAAPRCAHGRALRSAPCAPLPAPQPRSLRTRRRCAPRVCAAADATPAPDAGAPLGRRAACAAAALALSAAAAASPSPASAAAAPPEPPPEITQSVFLDFGLCDSGVRAERALAGGSGALCAAPQPLGRVVIGLYGGVVPQSVANFIALCTGSAGGAGYSSTVVQAVRPGEFIRAGAPGSARLGEVEAPQLAANPELASSAAFRLTHRAPGTVSLALAPDDDSDVPPRAPFTGFRITTGPGPVPSLDGANVVIGRVTAGLDVVAAVARTPTFAPLPSARSWNALAGALGDERAAKARGAWSKPRQAVVITACGLLQP